MADLIHEVPRSGRRPFNEAEFAEPPGTVNVKIFSDHVEVLWHTATPFDGVLESIHDVVEEDSELTVNDVLINITESERGEVSVPDLRTSLDDVNKPGPSGASQHEMEPFQSVYDQGVADQFSRCQLHFGGIIAVWTKETEPVHPLLDESDKREPLPYHLAVRTINKFQSLKNRIKYLYLFTGEPTISKDQREILIERVIEYASQQEFGEDDTPGEGI
jgi:hypothetical protein